MRRYVRPEVEKHNKKPGKKHDSAGNLNKVVTPEGKIYKFNKSKKKWEMALTPKGRKKQAVEFANTLRKRSTYTERLFRAILREVGIKHTFQKTIKIDNETYRFGDFYIPGLKWIVEIDGGYHDDPEQREKDLFREKQIIKVTKCKIVRFTNDEVENNPEVIGRALLDAMMDKILQVTYRKERKPLMMADEVVK